MNKKGQSETFAVIGVIVIIAVVIGGLMYLLPKYGVYQKELRGKADLKEAEWNKQIAIEEAKAELESATLKKEADIIRAEGIAEANKIIATSLTPEYIRWRWVENLNTGNTETIYVATEAGLPILEAGRFIN